MARWSICMLTLATAQLLGIASICRAKDLLDQEYQRTSRISPRFDPEELIKMKEALKGAIQIPTVSLTPGEYNTTALLKFGEFIRKVFPTIFNTSFIQHEVVGNYSHLFTIQGSDPSLQPYMLMAHIDVVPASEEGWEVPPFSGLERDGFINGRGTLDNKHSLMAILQALEFLLIRNYIPRRSFFIALGHDEEVYGENGAKKISALLQTRGVQLAFLVDEGSFILDGIISILKEPIAMIAVSEKGILNLMLQVNMMPGHSSAPPDETSIGILAAAVSRLEQTPMPNVFKDETLKTTLQLLAKEFPFPIDVILNNLWLFWPLVSRVIEMNPVANAFIRTTTALTMFNAGIKVNSIPSVAQATVNLRVHPSQTVEEVLEFVKNTVDDDRVQIHVLKAFNPQPASPFDDQALGYQLLHQTIQSVFPELHIIVPGICIANTDSRHFRNLTTSLYRFTPIYIQSEAFNRIHGVNEKISIQNYETQVKFMFELIQNADIEQTDVHHLHDL
ncbi:N-fatty-acyl-amino acid synthase/hydrolase PM20D1 [Suncus etruscus]|uniref:N-fatty-acyl-amino acid synthase/hydrolase PM20D1 n=1 Tax=Suncus etruscus TaxID=109475 RepID=UPI00210FC04B|nr:N-fatty-acyl-amino acid synthase/hydrolase PM20D1 [Suncus etruscus]